MKLNLFSYKTNLSIIGLIIVIVFVGSIAKANIENDIKNITSKLRCMTCQNQTVYSSSTDFSLNIKKIVEEKLKNNESEKEIIDFLIQRYGEYIVFEPQMNKKNIFLWCFPFVIMAFSILFLIFKIKKN